MFLFEMVTQGTDEKHLNLPNLSTLPSLWEADNHFQAPGLRVNVSGPLEGTITMSLKTGFQSGLQTVRQLLIGHSLTCNMKHINCDTRSSGPCNSTLFGDVGAHPWKLSVEM